MKRDEGSGWTVEGGRWQKVAEGGRGGGGRKRSEKGRKVEKEEEEIRTRETNDGNDEPNIDPVKPVRLPSLYSPRAALLHPPLEPQFLPLLSPSREQKPVPGDSRAWNALGTDDFFECGPKIAHGNNYCGGFLLKITDL